MFYYDHGVPYSIAFAQETHFVANEVHKWSRFMEFTCLTVFPSISCNGVVNGLLKTDKVPDLSGMKVWVTLIGKEP